MTSSPEFDQGLVSPASSTGYEGPTGDHLLTAALAALPQMTPKRLRALLRCAPATQLCADLSTVDMAAPAGTPRRDWRQLLLVWARDIERVSLDGVRRRYANAGVRVLLPRDAEFPARLRHERAGEDRAEVLFVRGAPLVAQQRRVVAMVGTRRATPYGVRVAFDLGQQVAAAGMVVASGLALGIDGASHHGALRAAAAPVLGVVGSGLDTPYPRQHKGLFKSVAQHGVLLTESPLGGPPLAENFPDRNRLLASLAAVLIVVESPQGGGSLITYRLAVDCGCSVMVVPGSIHSPMSAGPNGLLNEALPCRDVVDVEVAMGWALAGLDAEPDRRSEPTAVADRVLAAMGWERVSVDSLVERSNLGVGAVTLALAQLEADGWAARSEGRWHRLAAVR